MNTVRTSLIHHPHLCKHIGIAAFVLALLVACGRRPVAYEYHSTPIEGWEPGDTLSFRIDTLRKAGTYCFSVGVRSSSANPYPFQSLWLVVTRHWHNPEKTCRDTVECRLSTPEGDIIGSGVSIFQMEQPLEHIYLHEGASADVSITHHMQRDVLPGITNVGIRLERTE